MESDPVLFKEWAYSRIRELEQTVARLKDKIQEVESKNSLLVRTLSTLEDRLKADGHGDRHRGPNTDVSVEERFHENPERDLSPQVDVTKSSAASVDFVAGQVLPSDRLQPGQVSAPQLEDPDEKLNVQLASMPENLALQNDMPGGGEAQDNLGDQVLTKSKKKRQGRSLGDVVTRPIALKIMYLGSSYHGFASQGPSQKTVESELFAALEHTKLLIADRSQSRYSRCGRTDKGVSATGQVIALKLRSKFRSPVEESGRSTSAQTEERQEQLPDVNREDEILETPTWDRVAAARASRKLEEFTSILPAEAEDEVDYVGVLNRVLPNDIRVLGWSPVPQNFHARFSCLYREYKYFFINENLDMDAMKLACSKFLGDHDFRNFCKMDAANVHNYRRSISAFDILPAFEGCGRQVWLMKIRGTAFLWHQVRCMAAVVFMVGKGQESPKIVEDLLDVGVVKRKPQYKMASELPLVLQACGFEGLSLHCPARAARHLEMHLVTMINQTLLKLAILHEASMVLPGSGGCSDGNEQEHVPLLRRSSERKWLKRTFISEIGGESGASSFSLSFTPFRFHQLILIREFGIAASYEERQGKKMAPK